MPQYSVHPDLPAYNYANPCPVCGAATSEVAYHERPVLDRQGSWPCRYYRPPQLGQHHCRTCDNCGHRWMEAIPTA
jgi:hypothetical protein